jgi:hypothetical protein
VRHESQIPERPQKPRVTVETAVEAYLADPTSRGATPATQTKLTTIFRKQFLSWTRSQGLAYLDEIDLDALLNFCGTWSDGGLAKKKKQSRLMGFFWACVRRRYLQENPALGLGKIKVVQIPTDYRRLFKLADIRTPDGEQKRCRPHMFRDTFAVEMLLAGVPIDQVPRPEMGAVGAPGCNSIFP